MGPYRFLQLQNASDRCFKFMDHGTDSNFCGLPLVSKTIVSKALI